MPAAAMTLTTSEPIIWRGMTRAELDAAYNNSAAVKTSAAKLAAWTERSAALRAQFEDTLDLAYGPRPRNRIDLFRSGRPSAPLFAFIHGGYWQRNAKEIFACFAEGALARGFDVAMIGYTLAPEATLGEIVKETHAALAWLRRECPPRGIARGRLIVSGWSAGGHLAAMAAALAEVDATVAISGIFDIAPCRLNYLNAALNLTEDDVARLSPILHLPRREVPQVVAYGTRELPELQRQSRDYAAALDGAGRPAELLPVVGCDHFSILEELAHPAGRLVEALARL